MSIFEAACLILAFICLFASLVFICWATILSREIDKDIKDIDELLKKWSDSDEHR